jgi:hypothetical protein
LATAKSDKTEVPTLQPKGCKQHFVRLIFLENDSIPAVERLSDGAVRSLMSRITNGFAVT